MGSAHSARRSACVGSGPAFLAGGVRPLAIGDRRCVADRHHHQQRSGATSRSHEPTPRRRPEAAARQRTLPASISASAASSTTSRLKPGRKVRSSNSMPMAKPISTAKAARAWQRSGSPRAGQHHEGDEQRQRRRQPNQARIAQDAQRDVVRVRLSHREAERRRGRLASPGHAARPDPEPADPGSRPRSCRATGSRGRPGNADRSAAARRTSRKTSVAITSTMARPARRGVHQLARPAAVEPAGLAGARRRGAPTARLRRRPSPATPNAGPGRG